MTTSRTIFHWKPAVWLKVEGPDALDFLQGQFTNDLRSSQPGSAVYGLWLNQKGKIVADSFVLRAPVGPGFWVGSYFSPADTLRERLESYLIADDVTITDETPLWFGVTLAGEGAEDLAREWGSKNGALVFPGRRGLGNHWECVGPSPVEIPGAIQLSERDLTLARLRAGIPAIPADLGPGELPNEGGLETSAISYTKGCYLGQEVMARLKSMGQVRRQLTPVSGQGHAPASGSALFQGSRKVGELRSAANDGAGFRGLALLTTLHLDRQARLRLAPDGPDVAELAVP